MNIKEQINKVLSAKNWTGHTLRELASYGRVVPDKNSITSWCRGALGDMTLGEDESISTEDGLPNWAIHDALGERQCVEAGVAREVTHLNAGPQIYETTHAERIQAGIWREEGLFSGDGPRSVEWPLTQQEDEVPLPEPKKEVEKWRFQS
mgnify:CR=1 FL=1|jgi:hypothetical protein|tara:strand:- start:18 stop:467 length:450 start_codon:yes stop_codon:yes gene_type:complete